jgi:excisionase family DNA binding protein
MCDHRLLLTVLEAAERLGLKRSKTYELLQSGALPSVRIGGARRVLASDLYEFVQQLKSNAGEESE